MSTSWDGRKAFELLLCSIYTEAEFRRFIKLGADGEIISQQLPSEGVSNESLIHHAVDFVLRRNLIDPAFFERLVEDAPRREEEIRRSWRSWNAWNERRTNDVPSPELADVDSVRKSISDELYRLAQQRESLAMEGHDTSDVDSSIMHHQRELRQGAQLKPGDFLYQNRYRLIAKVGHGSFATVWQAYDRIHRIEVAVKVLHGHWMDNQTVLDRFTHGPRQAARIQHPNIVKVLRGTFQDGGYCAYVMEYVPGENLHARITKGGMLPRDLLLLFSQLCDGLQHAHEYGFVHRDIKPSNILIGTDGVPRLADFDLSKVHDLGDTQTGAIMGTVLYMAPEIRDNAKNASPLSDLYSLGMALLFCLLRSDPPLESSARERWLASLSGPPELRSLCEWVSSAVPDRRPASARAMGQALARLAERLPPGSSPTTGEGSRYEPWSFNSQPIDEVQPTNRRAHALWALIPLLMLSLAGAAYLFYRPAMDASPEVPQPEAAKLVQTPEPTPQPTLVTESKKVKPTSTRSQPPQTKPKPPRADPDPPTTTSQATLDANADIFAVDTQFQIRSCANRHQSFSNEVSFMCEAGADGNVKAVEMIGSDDNDAFKECAEAYLRKRSFRSTGQTENYRITYRL